MPSATLPSAILFFGNQALSVKEAAEKFIDSVLGDAPRDFSLTRFDAAEMARRGARDAAEGLLGEFQLACESAPFLAERWVVRLERMEMLRPPERAARNLRRIVEDLRLFRVDFEGGIALAMEEDLLTTDERQGGAEPQQLVSGVVSRGGGHPVLVLYTEAIPGPYLLSQGGSRRLVDGRAFLREKLKGRFSLATPEELEDGAESQGDAPARLHALLERLITTPPPGLHLVLTASAGRESDLSRGLLALLKKHGRVEKFVTYDDYNPVDWVLRESRRRGLQFDRNLAELLIYLAGNDLGRLASELDKLALVFGEGQPPHHDQFVRAVSGGQGGSLFLITERLGAKDLPGALAVLEHFLQENPGAHPLLVGILARHVRQLLHLHDLMRLEVPESDWPSQLKLHPFIARRLAQQARRFDTGELESILRAVAGLDRQLKSYGHLTAPLLRDFVQAFCQEGFRRPRPEVLPMVPGEG